MYDNTDSKKIKDETIQLYQKIVEDSKKSI